MPAPGRVGWRLAFRGWALRGWVLRGWGYLGLMLLILAAPPVRAQDEAQDQVRDQAQAQDKAPDQAPDQAPGPARERGQNRGPDSTERLILALRLAERVELDAAAALARARALDAEIFGASGASAWQPDMARLLRAADMLGALRDRLRADLTEAERLAALDFYETAAGRWITALDLSARRALADPDLVAAAAAALATHRAGAEPGDGPPLRLVAAPGMVARSIAGAVLFRLRFRAGLRDGGALPPGPGPSMARILADAPQIRQRSTERLLARLLLAQGPLDPAEAARQRAFAETGPGRALEAALFAGLDLAQARLAYGLGRSRAGARPTPDL